MDVVTATTSLFCPVRHHSPACAYAVLSLIDSVKPDYILIEGPDTFNSLIPSLTDKDTLLLLLLWGKPNIVIMIVA